MKNCSIGPASSTDPLHRSAAPAAAGVVVLGPGRSGTSAIARAFVAAGFFAGGDGEVLGAARGNPVGHFEPLPVLRLNEALLAELGCSWWADSPDRGRQLRERERVVPQLKEVLEAMRAAAPGVPLVVKEPRINALLPLWAPAIEGLLHPVLVVRNPIEIALSHARRDGTTRPHALAAWELQMATLLDWLDGRTVTVAPYAELIRRSGLAVETIAVASAHLEPGLTEGVREAAARGALDPSLRHHAVDEGAHAENLTARQQELWEFLRALPPGDVELAAPEELRSAGEAALAAVRKESEQVAFACEHEKVVGQLEELNVAVAALESALAASREHLAEVQVRHAEEVEAIFASKSWRLTSPLRRLRRLRDGAGIVPADDARREGRGRSPAT
jgi:hypothetical protein